MLPILEKPFFTVNKIYTLPISLPGGGFSVLENIPSFFLNSSFAHKNFQLNELQFQQNCKSYNSSLYLCKQRHPMRLIPSGDCISRLFNNPYVEPSVCSHRFLPKFQSFVLPLEHENSWIYWVHMPTILYSQCPEALTTFNLKGTGIIKLNQKCEFRVGQFIIPYRSTAQYNLEFHQPANSSYPSLTRYETVIRNSLSSLNITYEDIVPLDSQILKKNLQEESMSVAHLENELDKSERQLWSRRTQLQVHCSMGIFGTILIMVVIVFIYKRMIKGKTEKIILTERARPIEISLPTVVNHRDRVRRPVPTNEQMTQS